MVQEQVVDWDLQRVKHVESGKVDTMRTRAGSDVRPWSPTNST